MKKRLLSMLLAVLMVFGLTVPALAGDATGESPEAPKTELSYADLYVPGAILAYSPIAQEDGTVAKDAVLATATNEAILTVNKDLSILDGALQLIDASIAAPVFAIPEENADIKYTTQITLANLDVSPAAAEGAIYLHSTSYGSTYRFPFSRASNTGDFTTFGVYYQFAFITKDNAAAHNLWASTYIAAKDDESLRADSWFPLRPFHKDMIAAQALVDTNVVLKTGAELVAAGKTAETVAGLSDSAEIYYTNYAGIEWLLGTKTTYTDSNGAEKTANSNIYYTGITLTKENLPQLLNGYIANGTYNSVKGWTSDFDREGAQSRGFSAHDFGEVYTLTTTIDGTFTAGEAKPYAVNQKILLDGTAFSDITVTGASNIRNYFRLNGLNAAIYGIRIYDKVLNADELAQNHFAELAEYYQIDLAKVAALSDEAKKEAFTLSQAFVIGETSKEEVESLLAEPEEMVFTTLYNQMYVQDNLVFLWDAFDYVPGIVNARQEIDLADKSGNSDVVLTLPGAFPATGYLSSIGTVDFTALAQKDEKGNYTDMTFEASMVLISPEHVDNAADNKTVIFDLGTMIHGSSNDVVDKSHGFVRAGYSTYRAGAVTTVDYYFDASGNRLDSAEGAAKTVSVPYPDTSITPQIPMDAAWGNPVRFFSNPLGESFSLGASLDYTMDDAENGHGQFVVNYNRDTLSTTLSTPVAYTRGYTFSKSKFTQKVPADLAEAEAMAKAAPGANMTIGADAAKDPGNFRFGFSGGEFGLYTFRVYSDVLTDDEYKQNHFADLAAFHKIGCVEEFMALSDASKLALYTKYSEAAHSRTADGNKNTSYEDVTKEAIEADILAAFETETEEKLASLEDLLVFNGYQTTLYAGVAFRTVFTADKTMTLPEGVTLVSVGVACSAAYETADEMFASEDTDDIVIDEVYTSEGGWDEDVVGEDGSFTFLFDYAEAMSAEELSTEILICGFVVVSYANDIYLIQCDMAGNLIPDGRVSMYELASLNALKNFPASKAVIEIVEGAE